MKLKIRKSSGFTLVELLVVIAIIAILTSILFPAFDRAKLRAKINRVHSDLRYVAVAIEAYTDDFSGFPPTRESCKNNAAIDYYDLPRELYQMHYLSTRRMLDPFNTVRGENGQEEHRAYKYMAIGWGYSNDYKTQFAMWIPKDYPVSKEDCVLYYVSGGRCYRFPGRVPAEPPVKWAVWSVGPAGDPGWVESGMRLLPVPKREWYPIREDGIIVRLSDGRKSP